MKKAALTIFALAALAYSAFCQEILTNHPRSTLRFSVVKDLLKTEVKNQNNTSTCWSFSTLSFIESELLKAGKPQVNLSEMFIVRQAYMQKASNYLRMHGQTSLGPGGAFHDVAAVIREFGVVPEHVYPGNPWEGVKHDHTELDAALKAYLDVLVKNETRISEKWKLVVGGILDAYLGKVPEKFDFQGKSYTSKSFADFLGIRPDDFIELTSFSHHPLYKPFVLEVPDNWSWSLVQNISLSEMQEVADFAIQQGYTIAWAADVSEKGFSFRNSLAVVPEKEYESLAEMETDSVFLKSVSEKNITPELRQEAFDNYTTQDDHGMHITGMVKSQSGKPYYIVKNSWGSERNHAKGYFYCSVPYYLFKTTSIMVHRNGIPKPILAKLKL
jgi:bleomycin hydrolase